MHEISLAGSIIQLVEEAAVRERFSMVTRLHLSVGALAGIDVDALRFACDACFPNTILNGAELVIDSPPASAWCEECAEHVSMFDRLDPCPECGGLKLRPMGGTDLKVIDMLVLDRPRSDSLDFQVP
jgi:hydrogenase nickel incorporation protein HypA/HybF